ncbi:hypothetical protein [Serratia fonticola]|uniref:hypothetical protein n=1 Tax=Serratia fonticola TaxID=47917 RepID=UPI001AE7CCBB|nr:hypothetical protein [Serratia fonticola]MBP0998612.1 hypothetical protein [Serratia fonticola]MBP1003534.1 hypothetical protein [Serratia fonticola]MBP1010982.1 hypothetical protein [Serratia fonticola]
MVVVGIISLKYLIKQIYVPGCEGCFSIWRWLFSLMLLADEQPDFSSKCALTASYRYFLTTIAKAGRINDKIIVNIVTINKRFVE